MFSFTTEPRPVPADLRRELRLPPAVTVTIPLGERTSNWSPEDVTGYVIAAVRRMGEPLEWNGTFVATEVQYIRDEDGIVLESSWTSTN